MGDSALANAARSIPGGFAGAFLRGRDAVILLVHPEKRDSAIAALAVSRVPQIDFQSARIESARWTYAQLYDWYRFVIPQAADAGISSAGIQVSENRILIGVVDERSRNVVLGQLEALDIPCELVGVVLQRRPTAAGGSAIAKSRVVESRKRVGST